MIECLLDASSAPILPSEFITQTCSIFTFELNLKVDKILDLGFILHHLRKNKFQMVVASDLRFEGYWDCLESGNCECF
jgi:hypothetical protein